MSYIKAEKVLPQELLEMIQEYVDGGYLYIPRKDEARKCWGESTNSKTITRQRNSEIYHAYISGASSTELAERYFLSIKSIQRIILEEKKKIA